MFEIRWHGRGGQGGVTAATLAGMAAALYEGKYAQSFPAFGAERRGAPVFAFTRVAESPIRNRSQVYQPSCVVIMDETLLSVIDISHGLKAGGWILINCRALPAGLRLPDGVKIATLDAAEIATKTLGVPIVNTAMLGALAGATGIVGIEAIEKVISTEFPSEMGIKNLEAARVAYQVVVAKKNGAVDLEVSQK